MITLIAAIGKNNELGKDNSLLWKISEDMSHFKTYTMGKVIVMGRKTYQSLGRVLPGRRNIVVSSQHFDLPVIHAATLESALSVEHSYDEMVIIGGAEIYRQTIDIADKLVITHIDAEFDADTFFPLIDLTKWKKSIIVDRQNDEYKYQFVEYLRI